MKPLKIFSLFLVAVMMVIASCTEETDVSPDNRAKFLGNWKVTETQAKAYYEVTISADPNATNRVLISNFGGLGSGQATAYITGSEINLDPDQTIAGLTFNGGGTIDGNTMNWIYSIDDGADQTTYSAIFTKK